jgi:hypothetical protein
MRKLQRIGISQGLRSSLVALIGFAVVSSCNVTLQATTINYWTSSGNFEYDDDVLSSIDIRTNATPGDYGFNLGWSGQCGSQLSGTYTIHVNSDHSYSITGSHSTGHINAGQIRGVTLTYNLCGIGAPTAGSGQSSFIGLVGSVQITGVDVTSGSGTCCPLITHNFAVQIGDASACSTGTTVRVTYSGPIRADGDVRGVVNIGNSWYGSYYVAGAASQTENLTISSTLGAVLEGGAISTSGFPTGGYDKKNKHFNITQTGPAATFHCGTQVTVALVGAYDDAPTTPTPSATVGGTPAPTATPTPPYPTASPIPTVSPGATPAPNATGTTVTNGTQGSNTGNGLTNQDVYNDVKQALVDAGNGGTQPGTSASGTNGGLQTGGQPDGEGGDQADNLTTAGNNLSTNAASLRSNITTKMGQLHPIDLPTTVGETKTFTVTLPGPFSAHGSFSIDLTPYDTLVSVFRALTLMAVLIGGWFCGVQIIRSGIG